MYVSRRMLEQLEINNDMGHSIVSVLSISLRGLTDQKALGVIFKIASVAEIVKRYGLFGFWYRHSRKVAT